MNFENLFLLTGGKGLLTLSWISWNLFFVNWLIDYWHFDISWFCFCFHGFVDPWISWNLFFVNWLIDYWHFDISWFCFCFHGFVDPWLSWNLFFVNWLIDYWHFDISWFCFCFHGFVDPWISWNLFFVNWLIDYWHFDISWFCFCFHGFVDPWLSWNLFFVNWLIDYWHFDISWFCFLFSWICWSFLLLAVLAIFGTFVPHLGPTFSYLYHHVPAPYLWLRPGPGCLWCSRVYILWWSSWKAFGRLSLMSPHSVPGWCQVLTINGVFPVRADCVSGICTHGKPDWLFHIYSVTCTWEMFFLWTVCQLVTQFTPLLFPLSL